MIGGMGLPDSGARGERLDVLRAWLIAEHDYELGRAGDADLTTAQDRVGDLLGPQSMSAAEEYVRENHWDADDLLRTADDSAELGRLLQRIEDARRPGFETRRQPLPTDGSELHWVARSPGSADHPFGRSGELPEQPDARPVGLLVMAEYSVGDPVWNRPHGGGGPVDLASLGVSEGLVRALRDWNAGFEGLALTDFEWPTEQAESAWVQAGLRLARLLQEELPDVEVRYFHCDDDRPVGVLPPDEMRGE